MSKHGHPTRRWLGGAVVVAAVVAFGLVLFGLNHWTTSRLNKRESAASTTTTARAATTSEPAPPAAETTRGATDSEPLGLMGSVYAGIAGDEHYPYPTAGAYNVIADVGGLMTGLDRTYNPGVTEAQALREAIAALLPADAKLASEQTRSECHNYVYTSAALTAQARFHGGDGGLTHVNLSLSTGDISSRTEAYDPKSVNYVIAVGGVDNDVTPSRTC